MWIITWFVDTPHVKFNFYLFSLNFKFSSVCLVVLVPQDFSLHMIYLLINLIIYYLFITLLLTYLLIMFTFYMRFHFSGVIFQCTFTAEAVKIYFL